MGFLAPDDRPALVHRSATPLPSYLFEFSVLNNDRHCRVSIGYRQHLFPKAHVVLRVKLLESDSSFVVVHAGFLAVWTARFGVYFDFQSFTPQITRVTSPVV